jgi:hypothetical protein
MKTFLSKYLLLVLLFSMQDFGISVYAQAADKLPTSTSDGRAFTALTEKEVDALPDPDFDAYHKWRLRLKVAEYNKQKARADEAAAQALANQKRADEAVRLYAEAKARADEAVRRRVIYEILNEQGTFLVLLVNLQNAKQPEYFEVIKKMNSKSIIKLTEKYEALRDVCELVKNSPSQLPLKLAQIRIVRELFGNLILEADLEADRKRP